MLQNTTKLVKLLKKIPALYVHIIIGQVFKVVRPDSIVSIGGQYGLAILPVGQTDHTDALPTLQYFSIDGLEIGIRIKHSSQTKTLATTYHMIKLSPSSAHHKLVTILVPIARGKAISVGVPLSDFESTSLQRTKTQVKC